DGLSDLIFTLRDTYFWSEYLNGPNSLPTERSETRYRYLIVQLGESDPEKLASSLSIGPYYEDNFFKKSKRGDFNGDGIVDFLYFDAGGRPYLTTFKKNASGSFFADSTSFSNMVVEGLREHAVVGDFTGDGKTDLMVPQEEGKESWKLYISTGRGFEAQHINNLARFNKNFEWHGDKHDRYINRQYFAQDLNKDGKADFIEFYSHVIDWAKSGKGANTKFIILYHENKGIDANGNIVFETKNIDGHWEKKVKSLFPYKQDWYPEQYGTIENNQSYDIYTEVQGYAFSNQRAHYSPVIGDFRINNYNEDILIFQKGTLVKYSHDKVSDEARIIAITQGGVTTKIDYKELDPNINEGFYEKVKEDQHYSYPYIEMDKVSGSYAVSQLRQEGRKQDFKYRGLAVHL
ncbi:VCBS repeat-containing protein, partial [Elizabethkingia anophelis]|uniref:FG-GAP repeat domain-containing protein n=1 Tax=Elizabethkingia anophelis TaxID=1117645 RepID=UPI001367C1ED